MALDQITSQSIASGAITVEDISNGSITAAKLHDTAIADKLGYTPVSPTQLNNLVDSAPTALDTLNELAAALNDDANFASTVTTALGTKANSSDVTSALALKANSSDITTSARNSISFTAGSGAYNSSTGVFTIPTNTNQLTNGSGYLTSAVTALNGSTGSFNLQDLSVFNRSLSGNGYQVLPGGVILQWGSQSVGPDREVDYSFPTSFPNGCYGFAAGGDWHGTNGWMCVGGRPISNSVYRLYNIVETTKSVWWIGIGF